MHGKSRRHGVVVSEAGVVNGAHTTTSWIALEIERVRGAMIEAVVVVAEDSVEGCRGCRLSLSK